MFIKVLRAEPAAHIAYDYTIPVETTHNAFHIITVNNDRHREDEATNAKTGEDDGRQNMVATETEMEEESQDTSIESVTSVLGNVHSSEYDEFSHKSTAQNDAQGLDNDVQEDNSTKSTLTSEYFLEEKQTDSEQVLNYTTNMLPTQDSTTEATVHYEEKVQSMQQNVQQEGDIFYKDKVEHSIYHPNPQYYMERPLEAILDKYQNLEGTSEPLLDIR